MKIRLVRWIRTELPRRKVERRVFSWTDLLQLVESAVVHGETLRDDIREAFGAALIDEFQDTDALQFRIFRGLYHGSDQPLFLIGDPKQAIYAFRGADIFAYLEASSGSDASVLTLTENWRADPGLVAATNVLFARARQVAP